MATDPMALANALDPSLYSQQLQAQQQQAIAQLLMQQGLAPMGGTESVGGVAIRRSPMEGAAKLAALLSGQSMQGQANQSQAAMMAQQSAAMRSAFGVGDPGAPPPQGQGQGSPQALGAALGGQPVPQAPQAGGNSPAGMMGLPGMSPMQSMGAYYMNPDKYMESYLKGYTPNDTTIQARQGGVDPMVANRLMLIKQSTDPKILGMQQAGMTPEMIYRSIYGEAAKGAEIERKPGIAFSNGLTGESGMVGKIPEGANVTGPPGPNGQVSVTPMPGNAGVLAGNSASTTAGTNSQTPAVSYDPKTGRPIQATKGQQVSAAQQQAADAESLKILAAERGQTTDPKELAVLDRMEARIKAGRSPLSTMAPEQAPGVVPGATNAQKELGDRFTTLRDGAANAQTTTSYLQTIKQLADKAATGQFSDRLVYLNSLLAQVGSERATDQTTANNLLNKYSNQIVARLGQGGLGTDAARSILASAYPNATMNPAAIREAADNIIGVNDMMKAKLKLLGPAANARNATEYQQAESTFDQIADPRVFQLAAMPAAEAAQFLGKMPKDVQADLRRRANALKQMGAF